MAYTVLNESLQVKGKLTLANGQGSTAFFADAITQQLATDNSSDPTNSTAMAFNEYDKQGNAKQWGHSITVSVEATDLGASISTNDYLMYFDDVNNHYYLMKVITAETDRNSGFVTISGINTAIYELGKQIVNAETTFKQANLQTVVNGLYKSAPFSVIIQDDLATVIDYTVSANTSLQAVLQDLQTKYDVDVDSWIELDESGNISDRIIYFGHIGQDNGELIRYGGAKGFENINAQELSDTIYTKLYVTGLTDDKNPTKGHIGSVNNGMDYIFDDKANRSLYAIGASQNQPVYLEGTITNELLSEPQALLDWAKQQMGIFNHPRFNYTVAPMHDQIVSIGDTITVQDFHIKPEILVTSKVIQKSTSFSSPETNTFVLGEFSSIFTENANKGAGIITLIKKDVTVVQEAADYAKTQADKAHRQAISAQEQAIHAQTSADGKTTTYTVDSVQDLPGNAVEGDLGWVKLSDGTHMFSYTDGKWVEKINPSMGADINKKVSDAVAQAKAHTDEVKQGLVSDIATAKSQATSQANAAEANAKSEATSQFNQAQNALSAAKTDLTNSIASEASARNEAVSAANSQAQEYVNQAKSDINDTINAINVGGRNYILNSSGLNATSTNRPSMYSGGTSSSISTATAAYNSDSITLSYTGTGTQEWYYALVEAYRSYASVNLDKTKQYTISVDVKGTVPYAAFRINNAFSPSVAINSSTWTRLTYTFTFPALAIPNADNYYIRLNATGGNFTTGQTLSFRNFKLEIGNKATDWTPAPEDVVLDYTTKDNQIKTAISQYQTTNDGKVSKVQTDVTTALGQVATKVSQTDYDTKTGDLTTKYTQVKQTADSQATDIVSIKATATNQASKINSISSDVNGTKQSISDIETTQDSQSDKINQITTDVNGTKQSITDIQTKDGKQDTRMGTIETSVSGVKSDFSTYKTDANGLIGTAQTTAQTAVDGLKTKVSQTDYNTKTGQLQTDLTTTTQTANQAKTDIVSIKQTDTSQDSRMNTIESDASGTKQTVSDIQTAQGKQSGDISTLQQHANGFEATVTKVNNLSVGVKNLVRKWSGQNASDTSRPYINDVTNTVVYNTKGNIYTSDGLFLQINDPKSEMYYSLVNAWTPLSQLPMLEAGETYTIGVDITGSFDYVAFRISDAWYDPKPMNHTKFERVYQQFTIPEDATQFYLRINASKNVAGEANFFNNQAMVIRNIALYKSTVKSDGAPAPEDIELALAQVKITADSISNFVRDSSGNISSNFQTALSKTSIITGSTLAASIKTQTSSQIASALTDNNGKIISLINQDSSGVQIAGKNIVLDGNVTVTNAFTVGQANIANGAIGTAQIGDASITSAKIANLDVSKLTGDTITGFNFNVNKQIAIATGGSLQSDVVNMSKNSFSVSAPNIGVQRTSSQGYNVTVYGTFNISSLVGTMSTNGTIYVTKPNETKPYKQGDSYSSYSVNNIYIYTKNYNNGDPNEHLNIASAEIDIMTGGNSGMLSDSINSTRIRASSIATTGSVTSGNILLNGNHSIQSIDGGTIYFTDANGSASQISSSKVVAGNMALNGAHTLTSYDGGKIWVSTDNGTLVDFGVRSLSQSSLVSLKENIGDIDQTHALNETLKTDVKKWNFIGDDVNNKHVSPMIDDVNDQWYIPKDWLSEDGKGVDAYTITGYLIQSIKALQSQITELKQG